jgi:hypothetical protein
LFALRRRTDDHPGGVEARLRRPGVRRADREQVAGERVVGPVADPDVTVGGLAELAETLDA